MSSYNKIIENFKINGINYLDNLSTFQSQFIESTSLMGQNMIKNGELFVKKPNKLFINYTTPEFASQISVNDKTIKFLDKKTNQLTTLDNEYSDAFVFLTAKLDDEKRKSLDFTELSNNIISICTNVNFKSFKSKITENQADQISCLLMSPNPLQIYGTEAYMYDSQTQTKEKISSIIFQNPKTNIDINDNVFSIKDTRIFVNNE